MHVNTVDKRAGFAVIFVCLQERFESEEEEYICLGGEKAWLVTAFDLEESENRGDLRIAKWVLSPPWLYINE